MIDELPDALVLGGGGTLGEAWLRGVLSGIEAGSGLDFRECEYLVGTSAGSIVAATLAAGRRPDAGEQAAREWARAVPDVIDETSGPRFAAVGKVTRAAAAPFANVALSVTAPAGRLVRAAEDELSERRSSEET
ncbi:patatin-like phospholipase family protein [Solirubrobacter phytolaccae]|uniref:Patatin-like phospholipase family protein n=1 Tax=Solirubrobacter phytolaccae TaxID=1404360 RepID=A0A9X3ND88_9ACTN|nr:patatin-like phospholipase family protein [Solirubrobacter phytolaccae]MDA0184298.1 patatin-like phospholipase family protein [Solirubrobacter phytolaccae]